MFEIEAERSTLIRMLNKAMNQKIAFQLMVGELEEITRPGLVTKITETHLQFELLYFQDILTIPLSGVKAIVERSKDKKSVLLEDTLPQLSRFSERLRGLK